MGTRPRKSPAPKKDEDGPRKWFIEEKTKFLHLLNHALLVSNAVGNRKTDDMRVLASWLYLRICVTGKSLSVLLEPQDTGYGSARYLDHASIAVISRAVIENASVLLYACDKENAIDEWECKRHLIDLHDYVNRTQFLPRIDPALKNGFSEELLRELRGRLEGNAFFKTINPKRQKALLEGADMFVDGRHAAMLSLGWGEDTTRAVYKYLSNQAHTLAMAFHRTAENELYKTDSGGARVVAAFALSFARLALGSSCLHMIDLFPDVELKFHELTIVNLRSEYEKGSIAAHQAVVPPAQARQS